MSVKCTSHVWEHALVMDGRELLVLLALADWANDDGICWYSVDRIAHKARTTQRTVQRILVKLEAAQMLRVFRDRGRNHTNVYQVLAGMPQKVSPMTPFAERDAGKEQLRKVTPMTPFGGSAAETCNGGKGDTHDTFPAEEKVTSGTIKGVTGGHKRCHPCHPIRIDTLRETSTLPAGEAGQESRDLQQVLYPVRALPGMTITALIDVLHAEDAFRHVPAMLLEQLLAPVPSEKRVEAINALLEDYAGVSIDKPVGRLKNYLAGKPRAEREAQRKPQDPVALFTRYMNEIVIEARKRSEEEREDYLASCVDKYGDVPRYQGRTVTQRARQVLFREGLLSTQKEAVA